MPVIRYRTRDLTRLLPGTARPAFRRMEKVTGRSDDMIILRGVNVFPTQIEEIVLRTAGLAPHFQLRLTSRDRMDQLTVLAEASAGNHRAAAARRRPQMAARRQGRCRASPSPSRWSSPERWSDRPGSCAGSSTTADQA